MNRRISVVWMILVFSSPALATPRPPTPPPLNRFAVTFLQRLHKEDTAPRNHFVASAALADAWLTMVEAAMPAQRVIEDPLLNLGPAERAAWRASLRELLPHSGGQLKRAYWEAQDSTVARPLRMSLGESLFQSLHKPAAEIPQAIAEINPGEWVLNQTQGAFREPTTFAHLVGSAPTEQIFLTDTFRMEKRFQEQFEPTTLLFNGYGRSYGVTAAVNSLATAATIQRTDFEAVALPLRNQKWPYAKGRLPEGVSLILISPNQARTYSEFRDWLTPERIEDVTEQLQRRGHHRVSLVFPTFAVSDKVDVCAAFAELNCGWDETESWLAFFAHRPALTVSADGTLPYAPRPAALVTPRVLAMAGSQVVFDRPFYFLLLTDSGTVLSLGSFTGL